MVKEKFYKDIESAVCRKKGRKYECNLFKTGKIGSSHKNLIVDEVTYWSTRGRMQGTQVKPDSIYMHQGRYEEGATCRIHKYAKKTGLECADHEVLG